MAWSICKKSMNIRLYQIFFDSYTHSKTSGLCIPYDNTWYAGKPLQPAFENHIIYDLIYKNAHENCDYFGVLSWQFEKKCNITIQHALNLISQDNGQHDVYTFFSLHTQQFLWRSAENWHKGITEIANHIFTRMGYQVSVRDISSSIIDRKTNTVYGNHFIARPEVYDRYVREFLKPTLDIMTDPTDEWLQERINRDSGYKKKVKNIECMTGKPYYTLHTFVCERLFSTWLSINSNPYRLKHIK